MTSRLAQLQARFQQKQMQEKEEKLLKIYENQQQKTLERVGRNSAGSNTSNGSIGTTKTKVRPFFEERRKAGVDKSYPLEPLKQRISNGKISNSNRSIASKTVVKSTTVRTVKNGKSMVNGIVKITNNNNSYQNGVYQETSSRIEYNNNNNGNDVDHHLVELLNNHNLDDNYYPEELPKIGFNDNNNISNGKLANHKHEVIKGNLASNKKPVSKSVVTSHKLSSSNSSLVPSSASSSTKKSATPSSMSQRQGPSKTPTRPPSKQPVKSPVIRDDLAECQFCGRRFATDRVAKHEEICGKTGKKKRKVYDATKHRVVGTDLEAYALKGGRKKGASVGTSKTAAKSTPAKKDWRRTHEEFIAAIRSAKQVQAHIAKGGKLSDLPPPPPSTNPDYIQCPHCGRKFNESAAARHIPKCATYQFNKPKNGGSQAKKKPGQR